MAAVCALVGSWLHRRKHVACILRSPGPRSMARPMSRHRLRSLFERAYKSAANPYAKDKH